MLASVAVPLLGWSLLAGFLLVVASRSVRRWTGPGGELEEIHDSKLPEIIGGGAMAVLALAFVGGMVGPALVGGGASGPPAVEGTPGQPGTPVLDVAVLEGDSTVTLSTSAFNGAGADTQASTSWWIVSLANAGYDTVWSSLEDVDSLDHWSPAGITGGAGLVADSTHRAFVIHTATQGGDSDPDSVEFEATEDTPFLSDDFSTYSALSELIADENGIYSEGEFFCTNGCAGSEAGSINLDTDTVYPGHTRSLRYDYTGGVGGRIAIVPSFPADKARVWLEAAVKFGNGFTVEAATPPGGAGLKFLFLRVYESEVPEGGRFALEFGNGDAGALEMYGPNDDLQASHVTGIESINSLDDNDWHVVRWHVDAPADSMRFWIDGVSQAVSADFDTDAQVMYGAHIGNHMNKNVAAQSYWWGYWKAYDTDPGW